MISSITIQGKRNAVIPLWGMAGGLLARVSFRGVFIRKVLLGEFLLKWRVCGAIRGVPTGTLAAF